MMDGLLKVGQFREIGQWTPLGTRRSQGISQKDEPKEVGQWVNDQEILLLWLFSIPS
jgi:hypothetical protein